MNRLLQVFVLGGLIVLALQGVALFASGDRAFWLAAIGSTLAAAFAFGSTLTASLRVTDPRVRLSWRLWTCATGCWLAGALVRDGVALAGSGSTPWATDVLWWLAAPLAAVGLLLRSPGRLTWRLVLLDTVPVVLFVAVAVRVAGGHPLDLSSDQLVASLYPALYALVLASALQSVAVPHIRASATWWIVTAGFCVTAVAAFFWSNEALASGPVAGHWFDLLWSTGTLLVAFAGVQRALDPRSHTRIPFFESGRELHSLPPVLALLGLIALPFITPEEFHPLVYSFMLIAVSAVATRLYLSRRASLHMLDRLRRSQEALHASESRYRSIFESAAIGSVVAGLDGRLVEVNKAFANMLGYEQRELSGLPIVELTHPDDAGEMLTQLDELVRGVRDSYQSERRYLRKDGSAVWGRVSASTIRDEQGEAQFVLGLIEDITHHKLAELKFQNLLESAPDAMVIVDAEGTIVLVNARTEQVFGYRREELVGRPVELLIPERFHGHHAAHRSRYAADPRVRPMGTSLDLVGLLQG